MKRLHEGIACQALVVTVLAASSYLSNAARQQPAAEKSAAEIARAIVTQSQACFSSSQGDRLAYDSCTATFCDKQCGKSGGQCSSYCESKTTGLFSRLGGQHGHALGLLSQATKWFQYEATVVTDWTHSFTSGVTTVDAPTTAASPSAAPTDTEIRSECSPDAGSPSFLARARSWLHGGDANSDDEASRKSKCASLIAQAIVAHARECFASAQGQEELAAEDAYGQCTLALCAAQCGAHSITDGGSCVDYCQSKSVGLFKRLASVVTSTAQPTVTKQHTSTPLSHMSKSQAADEAKQAAAEMQSAMEDFQALQAREQHMTEKMVLRAKGLHGAEAEAELRGASALSAGVKEINKHLATVQGHMGLAAVLSNMPGVQS